MTTLNISLRRLHRRFGDATFTERDGRAVTKITTFVAWAAAEPSDSAFVLRRHGSRYRIEALEGSETALEPAAPAPAVAPPPDIAAITQLEVHRNQGRELQRLRAHFGKNGFTTFAATLFLKKPNFEEWASDNPIQGDLQIIRFAERWFVADLTTRLAQKVVPRLSQLKQPFSIPAASLMLNGMPIPATSQILSRLVQGGAVKPGNKAGTFAVIPPQSEWWR